MFINFLHKEKKISNDQIQMNQSQDFFNIFKVGTN